MTRQEILTGVGLAAFLALVAAAEAWIISDAWPDGWKDPAQATLAGSIIAFDTTAFSALVSAYLKWVFDNSNLRSTHALNVRTAILGDFHTYAANYLIPLDAAAGDLSAYIEQYSALKTLDFESLERNQRKSEAAERAFYSLARFAKYDRAISWEFNLRGVHPPPGMFLASTAAERRVWDWIPKMWSLNLWNLDSEAQLVQALDHDDRSADEALQFLRSIRTGGTSLHELFESFVNWMDANEHLDELARILASLNAILGYELARVYEPWYRDAPPEPIAHIQFMEGLSGNSRDRWGLF